MAKYYKLPAAAVPVCISDLVSKNADIEDGKNVRVCGCKKPTMQRRAWLQDFWGSGSSWVDYYDPIREIICLGESPAPASRLKKQTTTSGNIPRPNNNERSTPTLLIDTSLIGSFEFNCCRGSQILCVGELQPWADSRLGGEVTFETDNFSHQHRHPSQMKSGDGQCTRTMVLKMNICKLVDGLDYERYCRYVEVIRQKNSLDPSLESM